MLLWYIFTEISKYRMTRNAQREIRKEKIETRDWEKNLKLLEDAAEEQRKSMERRGKEIDMTKIFYATERAKKKLETAAVQARVLASGMERKRELDRIRRGEVSI